MTLKPIIRINVMSRGGFSFQCITVYNLHCFDPYNFTEYQFQAIALSNLFIVHLKNRNIYIS